MLRDDARTDFDELIDFSDMRRVDRKTGKPIVMRPRDERLAEHVARSAYYWAWPARMRHAQHNAPSELTRRKGFGRL